MRPALADGALMRAERNGLSSDTKSLAPTAASVAWTARPGRTQVMVLESVRESVEAVGTCTEAKATRLAYR